MWLPLWMRTVPLPSNDLKECSAATETSCVGLINPHCPASWSAEHRTAEGHCAITHLLKPDGPVHPDETAGATKSPNP